VAQDRRTRGVELGRYTIRAGERIVYGQRVLGVARLTDLPTHGHGRRYIIERGLTCMDELRAIVAEYLDQAGRWDAIPAEPCCLLDHIEASFDDERRGPP
jgi:hypothetical protein